MHRNFNPMPIFPNSLILLLDLLALVFYAKDHGLEYS
jgi:hypothetical protein